MAEAADDRAASTAGVENNTQFSLGAGRETRHDTMRRRCAYLIFPVMRRVWRPVKACVSGICRRPGTVGQPSAQIPNDRRDNRTRLVTGCATRKIVRRSRKKIDGPADTASSIPETGKTLIPTGTVITTSRCFGRSRCRPARASACSSSTRAPQPSHQIAEWKPTCWQTAGFIGSSTRRPPSSLGRAGRHPAAQNCCA